VPDEGKSFVAVQLWRMLAEAGFRTILVDADLRKSVLKERHNFWADAELRGLDYYLSGQAEYADIIYKTNVRNGDMIPCTNLLENPATLFEDPRFKELFQQLSQEYRYVIVDAPPLVNVADGALIASLCDGAILVVNSGETPKALVRQSVNELERANCKLLGIVLNKAEVANRSYYKYYGKYYSNYYGEDREQTQ
jgi:capsular exopolysaccharide synthesis family protein